MPDQVIQQYEAWLYDPRVTEYQIPSWAESRDPKFVLKDFQREDVEFLLSRPNKRGILGHEVGVGKTFPVIAAALAEFPPTVSRSYTSTAKFLVAVPAYLIPQWKYRIEHYTGETVHTITGEETPKRLARWNEFLASGHRWCVLNHEMIQVPNWTQITKKNLQTAAEMELYRRNARGVDVLDPTQVPVELRAKPRPLAVLTSAIIKHPWDVIIIDESERVWGRRTLWAKGFLEMLSKYSPKAHLWQTTGTPMRNRVDDIFMGLKFCDPKDPQYRSYWNWVDEWLIVESTEWETIPVRAKNPEAFARYQLAPRMLRRILDMVPAEPNDIYVEMPDDVWYEYKMARDAFLKQNTENPGQWGDITSVMAQIVELRRIAARAKTPTLLALVKDRLEGGDSLVGWTHYKDVGRGVHSAVTDAKIKTVPFISGDMNATVRDRHKETFQNSTEPMFLLATVGSLMRGVDLFAAHECVFVEKSWLHTENDQCVGRIRRRGQEIPTVVTSLIAIRPGERKMLIDERIEAMLARKSADVNGQLRHMLREELRR